MPTTGCAANAVWSRPDRANVVGARVIELPSPNHAPRPSGVVIDVLVLHYTELPLDQSLDILRDDKRAHRVSAHYVLAEDGTLYRLVPEDQGAWPAGRSHWRRHPPPNPPS